MKQIIVTRTAKLSFDAERCILHIEMIAGNEISLEDSIAHKEAAQLLTNGVPHCTFVNALGNIDISSEARKFGSSPDVQKNLIAQAVLVNSLATRIAANFYIRFNKPPKPTRLFTNSEDAFSWLLYKKQEFDQAQSGL
ncbi:MAG: hypothetical protein ACK5QU_11175 [Bacteroidota bacterium]